MCVDCVTEFAGDCLAGAQVTQLGGYPATCNPAGDCCVGHPGLGCEDLACATCVCDLDEYCCVTQWDTVCAGEASNQCAASCASCPP
jgi:hypothetical protein